MVNLMYVVILLCIAQEKYFEGHLAEIFRRTFGCVYFVL